MKNKNLRRWAAAAHIVGIALAVCASPARAENDARLESALTDAMRLDIDKPMDRVGDGGAAIQGYVAAGYLAKRPNTRLDYTDYWWLKKSAPFMTHELVMIEQEYMSAWVGCCVSPGVGITVRVHGSTANLEQFARANKCSVETNVNLTDLAKYSHIALSSIRKGRYATMSCRERDIQARDDSQ